MNIHNLLNDKLVKFYGAGVLHTTRKTVTENASKAYREGQEASKRGFAISENPYAKSGDAIWTDHDCWLEGYNSI